MCEEMRWMVIRRDHDGNLDAWVENGKYARGLSEEDARALVERIYASHTKVHGQTYMERAYPKGRWLAYVNEHRIRV